MLFIMINLLRNEYNTQYARRYCKYCSEKNQYSLHLRFACMKTQPLLGFLRMLNLTSYLIICLQFNVEILLSIPSMTSLIHALCIYNYEVPITIPIDARQLHAKPFFA